MRVTGVIQPEEKLPNQRAPEYPLMATEVARYTGDVLAIVVAEDRYAAADGADAVDVAYDRLDAVVDALRPLGVASLEMPLTAETVWRALAERNSQS